MHPGKPSLIAATLLLFLPALAQPPAPQSSSTKTIKVFSRETIVDVIVTDAKGNAIRGLKQSDFTIQEDGKPQPIRSFGEFDRGFTIEPTPEAQAGVHSNLQASPTTGPVNILFIDALHLNFVGSNRALQAVAAYSARMPAGTQVAVFWLGVSGLHLLQGFSTDPAEIQSAVSVTRTDIGFNLDCYQTDQLTIGALNQVAAYVAGIKGRKNLIWMTPGVPVYLLRDGGIEWGKATACNDNALEPAPLGGSSSSFTGPDGVESPGLDMTEVHHLMDTYELFTAEQIAVSPLDPRGVRTGGNALGGPQLVAEEVAEQSGGFAKYNSNDLVGELAQVVDASSHYYTVSYIPPRRKDDGHYHHITIQVDRPGLRLTYRRGYNSEQPQAPREYSGPDLIKAALQGRAPAATQLIFQARLTPADNLPGAVPTPPPPPAADSESVDAFADQAAPKPTPANPPPATAPPAPQSPQKVKGKSGSAVRQPYDLLLAVPQNQITYGTAPGGAHTVKLQFAFDAYDLNGKLLGAHAQNVALTLTPERYALFVKAPIVFHEQISFLPGPLFLRIGVLDNTSNKVGTIEIPLTIPKR
jgi:VWFA-related protein